MAYRETKIANEILLKVGRLPGFRVWKRPTGVGLSLDGKRKIRFGIPGGADIEGIGPGGRHIEIEVKTPTGTQSDQQKKFQAMITRHGGVYILARSVDDAIDGLREAGL